MSTHRASTGQNSTSSLSPSEAFGMVLDAAVTVVAAKVERKAAGWIDKLSAVAGSRASETTVLGLADQGLDVVAESGGLAQRAGAAGVKAHLHGEGPTSAALRSVWHAGTPAVKAAMLTSAVAAIVLLALSPVLLVIYLLIWIVIAAVHRARAVRRRGLATA
ncbi:hypothetical protein [Nocardioides sp. CER19]|uniref:hypothetical protein n=1 Tax=Nocardioides sp. CER19 TaxID=3038538 RepID=UPI0024480AFA|nr:hypothetical protein [Nocardioides sp. CER19]MDH2413801.1 hypothetical protein [Nocardioides sp. CER19]